VLREWLRRIRRMRNAMTTPHRLEPPLAALLFLGLSMVSFSGEDGLLWTQALPWLLLVIAAGLWCALGWARTLAMGVLVLLLGAVVWPGGADWPPVRGLMIDPWVAARLDHHTGLHPTVGGTLVASVLLLWLVSPPVRRAFAAADLDAVRDGLPPLSDGCVKDDH
jgi:hypothetical protein